VALLLAAGSCLGYRGALGYRSRQAVLRGDAAAFEALMEEAATRPPKGEYDKPKKTVLTHFLDLAGDDRYFEMIERWRAKGWVPEDMTCPIHRARFAATVQSDPAGAWRAAEVVMQTARAASGDPTQAWALEVCLLNARFLVGTSTAALGPILAVAADPTEPRRFRHALLEGLTRVEITGFGRRLGNEPQLGLAGAAEVTRALALDRAARLLWLLDTLEGVVDSALLAAGTAQGGLEIENALWPLGDSLLAELAESDRPSRRALPWQWVRVMKARRMVERQAGLLIWSRRREPETDAYWFACLSAPRPPGDREGAPAPRPADAVLDLRLVLGHRPDISVDEVRSQRCAPGRWAEVIGPYPLRVTARAAAARRARQQGAGLAVGTRVVSTASLGGAAP